MTMANKIFASLAISLAVFIIFRKLHLRKNDKTSQKYKTTKSPLFKDDTKDKQAWYLGATGHSRIPNSKDLENGNYPYRTYADKIMPD